MDESEDNGKIGEISTENVLNDVKQLNNCCEEDSHKILKKLLPLLSSTIHESEIWQAILNNLLKFITHKNPVDQQQLCAHIYLSLFQKIHKIKKLESFIKNVLNANNKKFFIHNEQFRIHDLQIFKFSMINGYLLMEKQYSEEINRIILTILESHCMKYTKYTCTAFKSLKLWLFYIEESDFLKNDRITEFYEIIDALIFSNWDNCFPDVSKIISNSIFPSFLRIMQKKYPEFINSIHERLMKQLSWKNPLKYIILTKSWGSEREKVLQDSSVIQEVLKSLEDSSLTQTATDLYFSSWGTFSEDDWLKLYTKTFHPIAKKWEKTNNEAIERFWTLWMDPTLKRFSHKIIRSLWDLFFKDEMIISQSFLMKEATKNEMPLISFFDSNEKNEENGEIEDFSSIKNVWMKNPVTGIPLIFNDPRECVRANGFFMYCSGQEFKTHENHEKLIIYSNDDRLKDLIDENNVDYELCKWFLYYNAKIVSPTMILKITESLHIFLDKITSKFLLKDVKTKDFLQWIYEFIVNCLEMGSCKERKLYGLNLFEVVMAFAKNNPENLPTTHQQWSYHNKVPFYVLTRCCLDPIEEIREKSCQILCEHFKNTVLSKDETQALSSKATENCLSSEFVIISGGVNLWRIVSSRTEKNCPIILLEEARKQLSAVKMDIEALRKGASFYVTLMIFKDITLDQKNVQMLEKPFFDSLTDLLEEATDFFLSITSLDVECTRLSRVPGRLKAALKKAYMKKSVIDDSSTRELPPRHQNIVSSMWTSLKLICTLSGKLALLESQEKMICRRLVDVVVMILKRTRHRDVIEEAGSSLIRLMNAKILDTNANYFASILDDLFIADGENEINWRENGEKEVMMLHQFGGWNKEIIREVVDNIIEKILNFLRISQCEEENDDDEGENGEQENSLRRHLIYLQNIVKVAYLHPYYAHALEEIALFCLHCFHFTKSKVKNTSVDLFLAIIPRITGEIRDEHLDFGIGYSLDHFCTHFQTLAFAILKALKDEVAQLNHTKSSEIIDEKDDYDGSIEPILLLLSRISINDCCFFEHHYAEYRRDITGELLRLFAHPFKKARELAAKAYAALTLPQRIGKLLLLEKTTDNEDDPIFNQGSYSLQIYLQQRAKYASICAHNEYANSIKKGTLRQMERFKRIIHSWLEGECDIDYVNETMFLKSLLTSPEIGKCLILQGGLDAVTCWSLLSNPAIEEKIRSAVDADVPGFWEFMEKFVEINCFFVDLDEVDADQVIRIFSEINRYTVMIMRNLRGIKELASQEAEENIKKYFDGKLGFDTDAYKRISTLMDRGEFVHNMCYEIYEAVKNGEESVKTHLIEIVKFVIKIIRKGAFVRGVQRHDSKFGISNLITQLINAQHHDHKKLGYELIMVIGDHFDNYGYQRRAVEFFANVILYGDRGERLWGMDCLAVYLEGKKFVSIDNTLQLRIIECLVKLLNDEVPEIRNEVCKKFEFFEVQPRNLENPVRIIGNSDNYLHELLRAAITSQSFSQDEIYREWVHDITNYIGDTENDNDYRENGRIINILTHLIRQAQSSCCNYPDVLYERLDLSKIVKIGNSYENDYIDSRMDKKSNRLSIILSIDTNDYLADKKRILHNIIEQRKKKRV